MPYDIAILVPLASGAWRAHIPDYPGCRAKGATAAAAKTTAVVMAQMAADKLRNSGRETPKPRDLETIQADERWRADREINWASTVVSMVHI